MSNDKRFRKYANKGGDSGIKSTKRSQGKVEVRFQDGSQYSYTTESASANDLKNMRRQISNGQGLNSYINRRVAKDYSEKKR